MRFSSTAVLLSGLAVQQAAATWDVHAPKYGTPQNTDNECSDKQKGGYSWGDVPAGGQPGSFSGYDGFNFGGGQGGWSCQNSFGKRDQLTKRTFGGKCIKNTITPQKPASFDCGDKKGFSVTEFQVSVEYDTDVEFHYKMPDGSTCKQTAPCKKDGYTVKNTQCGGAKGVDVYLPSGGKGGNGKGSCDIGFHSIGFDCNPGYGGKTSTPSKPGYTPPSQPSKGTETPPKSTEAPSKPGYTPPSKPSESKPGYTPPSKPSESVPGKPSESVPSKPSETPSKPGYTPPGKPSESVPGKPSESVPSKPSETPSKPGYTPPGKPSESVPSKPSETPSKPGFTPPGKPSESVPSKPSETPSQPGYTPPGKPSESAPGKPSESAPGKPSESKPAPTPSSPGSPSSPGYSAPSTPSTPAVPTAPGSPSSPGAPGYTPSSTAVLPSGSSPATPPSGPGCPNSVPQCINTWLELKSECKDNTDYSCYCKNPEFTKEVIDCVSAWAGEEVQAALTYLVGICAQYVPQNPGIITNCPSQVPIGQPPATPAPPAGTPSAPAPPAGTPSAPAPSGPAPPVSSAKPIGSITPAPSAPGPAPATPVTTIVYQTTVTVPCSSAGTVVPGSSTVTTISTQVTVPQVVFTTAPPAPGAPSSSAPVNLVPGTPAPVPAQPTGVYPSINTIVVPSGNRTATAAPSQFTGAASSVGVSAVSYSFMGALLAFFAL